jgi:hypothetical protein
MCRKCIAASWRGVFWVTKQVQAREWTKARPTAPPFPNTYASDRRHRELTLPDDLFTRSEPPIIVALRFSPELDGHFVFAGA